MKKLNFCIAFLMTCFTTLSFSQNINEMSIAFLEARNELDRALDCTSHTYYIGTGLVVAGAITAYHNHRIVRSASSQVQAKVQANPAYEIFHQVIQDSDVPVYGNKPMQEYTAAKNQISATKIWRAVGIAGIFLGASLEWADKASFVGNVDILDMSINKYASSEARDEFIRRQSKNIIPSELKVLNSNTTDQDNPLITEEIARLESLEDTDAGALYSFNKVKASLNLIANQFCNN
ncbi:hypothetical protein MRY82_04395 [bacterium]|nr:hypothetical protein [bacterium]